MNYIAKFGLSFNPFIKNGKDVRLELAEFKQVLFRLKNVEKNKGICLITGEPGLGKTTSIRYWANSLNTSLYKVVYIPHTTLTELDFYRQLSDDFGLEPQYTKRKNVTQIRDEINRLVIEKRITPVIIVDEADHLPSGVLIDIQMLLSFNYDSIDKAILILISHPSFRQKLNLKAYEPLKQRLSFNYNIQPLEYTESKNYIDEKLKAAGLACQLLSDEAYNQIINASKGVPRVINRIMETAIILLENQKKDIIDEEIALDAVNEYLLV